MQLKYTGEVRWCPEARSRGDAKQPEEVLGPQGWRAQEGQRAPVKELPRSVGRECTAFYVCDKGQIWKSHLEQSLPRRFVSFNSFGDLTAAYLVERLIAASAVRAVERLL
jgi:hypothetical protein